ncbi:serine/threonine-protein kinase [Actinoplanes sp. NPDC051513]|uniref:serine/threonine-protein kinase n=1 Tax=Actinoplanes sp. NPDC051513 TaxID=3363908 RepID=UPI0037A79710
MDVDLAGLVRPGLCLGGRYRLVEPIGAGGMAVVWRSWDTVLTRTVAVKLLATHERDSRLAQIRREARIAAQLSHPNIAQVHDYGESVVSGELVPYVVLELIAGDTLLNRLRDGDLPAPPALRVGAEVAAALAAAHAAGLVHRDIKPANIMLAPTGAKVVDFGIAATRGPAADGDTVFGTPTYTAPERLTGDEVLPASDMYALGVLLYRLLAGHTPWAADPPDRVLANHVYAEPPRLVPLGPVPAEVLDLCDRCLRKDPNARPTAREAARLLAAAAGAAELDAAGAGAVGATGVGAAGATGSDTAGAAGSDTAGAARVDAAVAAAEIGPASVGAGEEAPRSGVPAAEPSTVVHPPARKAPRVVQHLIAAGIVLAVVTTAGWLAARGASVEPSPPPAVAAPAPPSASATPSATPPATSSARPGPSTTLEPTVAATRPPGTQGAITGLPVTTTASQLPGTTSAPPPSTSAPDPVERTLSSPGGTVTADCPAATTARILSWTAARSYRMEEADTTPGPAPTVVFRHGSDSVTMTVTCHAGVPRAQID